MKQQDIGLIGLAVMGQNLVLNIASHGFSVAVYNRTAEKTRTFMDTRAAGHDILGTYSLEDFVKALKPPRRIILMVKAGLDRQVARCPLRIRDHQLRPGPGPYQGRFG